MIMNKIDDFVVQMILWVICWNGSGTDGIVP
jgi:hypothetical protein